MCLCYFVPEIWNSLAKKLCACAPRFPIFFARKTTLALHVGRSCKRSLMTLCTFGPKFPSFLAKMPIFPKKWAKKTPEESFEGRHRIWESMPFLPAKRRALFRRELDLYRPHCCFRGDQRYAEKIVIYEVINVVNCLTELPFRTFELSTIFTCFLHIFSTFSC